MQTSRELVSFDRELQLYGQFDTGAVTPRSASEGRARQVPCGPFHAVEVVARNIVSRRGALCRPWTDQAILLVQHDGAALARQYNHQTWLRRGDIYLMDTRAPLELRVPDTSHATCIAIERRDLAVLGSRPETVFGSKISGDKGFARLLQHFLAGLLGDSQHYDEAESATVGRGLQALVGHALQAHPRFIPALTDVDQLREVKAWMVRNLDDPALDALQVARQFGLSRSGLYRLFAGQDDSPMAWLTRQRLARAHQLLVEAPRARATLTAICFGLGFNDPSHFSRAFRRQYGCSPRDVRQAARSAPRD